MKECYWRMPDKNMMGETTMQTTCSSGKRIATRQRWELQITTCGNFLREIGEKNKGDIHIKRNLRDPDVLKGEQRGENHEGKKLRESAVEKLQKLWRTSAITERYGRRKNTADLLPRLKHPCLKIEAGVKRSAAVAALLQVSSESKPHLLQALCDRGWPFSCFCTLQHIAGSVPCSGSETTAMAHTINRRV